MTHETVKADGLACISCAAKTLTLEGPVCQPWKLGSSNKFGKKHRFVLGRNQKSGTTMRPVNCPHPENTVSTTATAQVMLRKMMGR